VVGKPFNLFRQPVRVQPFNSLDYPLMEDFLALLEHAPIDNLVGERVPKSILKIREKGPLIEELGGLKVGEDAAEVFFGQLLRNSVKEWEGHVGPDDRCGLEKVLLLGGKPVNAGG
jgi:hypothetical protein